MRNQITQSSKKLVRYLNIAMEAYYLKFVLEKKGQDFYTIIGPHIDAILYYVRNMDGHLVNAEMNEIILEMGDVRPHEVDYHWMIQYDRRFGVVIDVTETEYGCRERCGYYCDRSLKSVEMLFSLCLDDVKIFHFENSDDSNKYQILCEKLDEYLAMVCSHIEFDISKYNDRVRHQEDTNIIALSNVVNEDEENNEEQDR